MDKISVIEWEIYLSGQEHQHDMIFDDDFKLDIFKAVFDQLDGHQTDGIDYRLVRIEIQSDEDQIIEPQKRKVLYKF